MKKIVIVGNSASGVCAAKTIRNKDAASSITIISQEKYPSYLRPRLFDYISADIKKDGLFYLDNDFYSKNNIELVYREVTRINEKRKVVFLDDKSNLDYDILILASGAVNKIPEIKGTHKYGVFEIRSLEDADKILEVLPVVSDVCIIGSGNIGIKAAIAFRKRNLDVTVITKSKFALSSYLDENASSIVRKRLEDYGVRFIFGQEVVEIIGDSEVRAVKLESGKVISSSLVLIAKGSKPNFNFIKDTEIEIDKGIVVNENFKTNIPNVYAAGEACQNYNFVLDKYDVSREWVNAVEQGNIVGENIVDNPIKYSGFFNFKLLNFLGLDVLSAGRFSLEEGLEEKTFFDEKKSIYKKVLLKDNVIKGAILIGDLAKKGEILSYIKLKQDISGIKNTIFD